MAKTGQQRSKTWWDSKKNDPVFMEHQRQRSQRNREKLRKSRGKEDLKEKIRKQTASRVARYRAKKQLNNSLTTPSQLYATQSAEKRAVNKVLLSMAKALPKSLSKMEFVCRQVLLVLSQLDKVKPHGDLADPMLPEEQPSPQPLPQASASPAVPTPPEEQLSPQPLPQASVSPASVPKFLVGTVVKVTLYGVKRRPKSYLAVLVNLDEESQSAEVRYLAVKHLGKFSFPPVEDHSWEPLTNIANLKSQPSLVQMHNCLHYKFPVDVDPFDTI